MIAGSQTIADDRRRSQTIGYGSIFCDRLRSRSRSTLLYAMFVYNARREDWIQENDVAYSQICGYDRAHVCVFVSGKKKFHSGERFQKFPDTAGKYAGYVCTQAVFVKKKNWRFHKFPDTCGRGLNILSFSLMMPYIGESSESIKNHSST